MSEKLNNERCQNFQKSSPSSANIKSVSCKYCKKPGYEIDNCHILKFERENEKPNSSEKTKSESDNKS